MFQFQDFTLMPRFVNYYKFLSLVHIIITVILLGIRVRLEDDFPAPVQGLCKGRIAKFDVQLQQVL